MNQLGYSLTAIGWVESCFKEKFATPRQSGLVPSATAKIWMNAPYDNLDAFDGIESNTHLWLQFVFHQIKESQSFSPKVRPPRLGGNKTTGVFATRSPNRPNRLGLSVVKNQGLYKDARGVYLLVSGVDLIEGTPILDIKPYIPYVDSIVGAKSAFAPDSPECLPVHFSDDVQLFCEAYSSNTGRTLDQLIVETLQQDPRPQYHSFDNDREYAAKLLDVDVRWRYYTSGEGLALLVVGIEPI